MSAPKRLATSPSPLPGCLVRENNSFSHPLQAYEVLIWFLYSIFSLFQLWKRPLMRVLVFSTACCSKMGSFLISLTVSWVRCSCECFSPHFQWVWLHKNSDVMVSTRNKCLTWYIAFLVSQDLPKRFLNFKNWEAC